jgi:predicted acyltransferase
MNTNLKNDNRESGLDALRGFAILTMVLSGIIPYRVLPSWMYHAQLPPPEHVFNPGVPGITWVDLVFPFFLFALGAAIPFALNRRLQNGHSLLKITGDVVWRGILLIFFAIFLQHVRPYTLNPEPGLVTWLTALAGFAALFAIFLRVPSAWPSWSGRALRFGGWISAILLLWLVRFPDGSGFSLYRSDIIIIVLANMAVFGALIWLATRERILVRLSVLGIIIALRLSAGEPGWVEPIWAASPIPWAFRLYYLQYLFIVIPGSVAGDMLWQYMNRRNSEAHENRPGWSTPVAVTVAGISALLIPVMLIGLHGRHVTGTLALTVVLVIAAVYLMHGEADNREQLYKNLFYWGAYFLFLGLAFEPYEGGIRKDSPTMSYYLVTTGLSFTTLLFFKLLMERLEILRGTTLLADNGQNPMIAYVGMMNLLLPLLALTGIDGLIRMFTAAPWAGFARGLVYTIALALIVKVFTRHKLYWRT